MSPTFADILAETVYSPPQFFRTFSDGSEEIVELTEFPMFKEDTEEVPDEVSDKSVEPFCRFFRIR